MPVERITDQLATWAGTGDTTGRYDAVTIALHWTTAVLVVLQWSVAQVQAQPWCCSCA